MKNKDFLRILGEIDSKYIEKASEDLSIWQESQKGISVCLDYYRKFSWKTSIASVACTAVAVFGIFVLLLNVGKIGITENPASSVSEPDNSTISQNDVIPDVFLKKRHTHTKGNISTNYNATRLEINLGKTLQSQVQKPPTKSRTERLLYKNRILPYMGVLCLNSKTVIMKQTALHLLIFTLAE